MQILFRPAPETKMKAHAWPPQCPKKQAQVQPTQEPKRQAQAKSMIEFVSTLGGLFCEREHLLSTGNAFCIF